MLSSVTPSMSLEKEMRHELSKNFTFELETLNMQHLLTAFETLFVYLFSFHCFDIYLFIIIFFCLL